MVPKTLWFRISFLTYSFMYGIAESSRTSGDTTLVELLFFHRTSFGQSTTIFFSCETAIIQDNNRRVRHCGLRSISESWEVNKLKRVQPPWPPFILFVWLQRKCIFVISQLSWIITMSSVTSYYYHCIIILWYSQITAK